MLLAPLGAARDAWVERELVQVPASGVPRDGRVHGSGRLDEGFFHAHAEFHAARLGEVQLELDVSEAELEPTAAALATHWGVALKKKARRLEGHLALAGAVAGLLTLRAEEIRTGGDPLFRITLRAAVDDVAALKLLETPVSLDALADVLATGALPREAVVAVLQAAHATGARALVPDAVREVVRALPREVLLDRSKRLLSLADTALGNDPVAFGEGLRSLNDHRGGWLRVEPELRLRLVRSLSAQEPRAAMVELIVEALDFGDRAALGRLIALSARCAGPERKLAVTTDDVTLEQPAELQDAVLAVLTAGWPPAAVAACGRVSWVHARAASRLLRASMGPPPDYTTAQVQRGLGKRAPAEESWRLASVCRAQLLAQVRTFDAQLFAELAKEWSYDEAAFFLVADARAVSPSAGVYRLGRQVWTFKRSPKGKQSVELTEFADESEAAAAVAPKQPAVKKKKRPDAL